MKKKMGLSLFVAAFTAFSSMYVPVMADDASAKTVFFTEDGVSAPYSTKAQTVDEFLDELGVSLNPRDTLNMQYTDVLESGSQIEIKRGFYVNASVDGNTYSFKVCQDTPIGTFIRQFEEERKQEFYYTGSLAQILSPGQTVLLTAYREETVSEESEIPFDTQTEETADLLKGTEQVSQEGRPGVKITEYKVIYLGDEEQSREVISETIGAEPVTKIIKIGTAQPKPPEPKPAAPKPAAPKPAAPKPSSGSSGQTANFSYSKVYTMVATAYHAGVESTGKSPGMPGYGITASGMRVRPGVVAVDPRVIPLGTHLYVEGYGYSIAADTGGAIKGNRIDLYYETLAEVNRYGLRTVKVYVLD